MLFMIRCKHCWHMDRAHLDREISDMVNQGQMKKGDWLPLVRRCRTLYTVDNGRCECPGYAPDSKRYKHRARASEHKDHPSRRNSASTWVP